MPIPFWAECIAYWAAECMVCILFLFCLSDCLPTACVSVLGSGLNIPNILQGVHSLCAQGHDCKTTGQRIDEICPEGTFEAMYVPTEMWTPVWILIAVQISGSLGEIFLATAVLMEETFG